MEPTPNKRLLDGLKIVGILVPLSIVTWIVVQGVGNTGSGYAQPRTAWDWTELLLIPLILAGSVLFLTGSGREMKRRQQAEQAALEREIATDRQQETALQAYFDRMSELLLKDKLSKFSPEEVRNVARIRTLSVLRGLDARRKGLVFLFLRDSGLIDREAVIDLCGADLRGASLKFASLKRVNVSEADLSKSDLGGANLSKSYLSGTNLSGANLSGANLSGVDLLEANLSGANLTRATLCKANLNGADLRGCCLNDADLSEADLSAVNLNVGDLVGANLRGANLGRARLLGANLSKADLSRADLSGTEITSTELEKVKSLEGATLPDGTKHE